MTLESQVADLTFKVGAVLDAINVSKSYLDAAAKAAIAGVTAQGAMLPTPAKSPLGNDRGVFDPAWLDPKLPILSKSALTGASLTTNASGTAAHSAVLSPPAEGRYGYDYEMIRIGVAGIPASSHPGYFSFLTASGNNIETKIGYLLRLRAWDIGSNSWSTDLLRVGGDGQVYIPLLKVGTAPYTPWHQINYGVVQGDRILDIGAAGAGPSVAIQAGNGITFGQPQSVMYVGQVDSTGRSSSNTGTVNTGGNDYAEYIFKCSLCSAVAKGQIVGITSTGTITDIWTDATLFAIKSTDPSFVGGDTWASSIGSRPIPQAGSAPMQPSRRADEIEQQALPGTNPPQYQAVMVPGDTDAEWAEKQAAHSAALAAHINAMQQDAKEMALFDAALEVERQKVDRIAIAGRVPVNVWGANPGDYIVPAQDGAGIMGLVVAEADITLTQYMKAVGKVINTLPDGRAYVMVKSA